MMAGLYTGFNWGGGGGGGLLGRPSLTHAYYHEKCNLMDVIFGKDVTHNMGAFLSKN